MSFDEMPRRGAFGTGAAVAALSLTLTLQIMPAGAQGYGAPPPTSYGRPYTAPPTSYAGARDRGGYDNSYSEPVSRPGIWKGLYVGGNLGYATGSLNPRDFNSAVDLEGAAIGLHAGYNWQFNRVVLGVEGDMAWSNADGTRTMSSPAIMTLAGRDHWLSSMRLRAGVTWDNILLYATGGVAFANFEASANEATLAGSARETLFGYAVGGGIEMKFTDRISGRLEALHYGFNDKTMSFPVGGLPVDANMTTVRAGLTFHFN